MDLPSQILGEEFDCSFYENEAIKIVETYKEIPFSIVPQKIYAKNLVRTKPSEAPKDEKVRHKLFYKLSTKE